ncbi:MAG: glycosyltransferase family 2 protein [Oscillospiraceae bacterium]|nr:glycosyltransferase family 2 protein [Oscillospiraceae bacterium]
MDTLKLINTTIAVVFFVCYAYQFFYIPIPHLKAPPPHSPAKANRYAVCICARNEEAVITDLIDSLKAQTYDPRLFSVFVIADNCTDSTAEKARRAGAIVYERENKKHVGKGYALECLLDHINRDCPGAFDGYFVFDADNILEPDYIEQMNRSFSDGYDIVTSYRNSKNYGDNWISAGYALWFLRESRYLNNARMLLNTSCAVSGTGFVFSQRILDSTGGWHFHLLTEDIEFSVHHILRGVKIGFCPEAVLYDEQPVLFSQSWRQRMRWAKGYLQVFQRYGADLVGGALRGSFSCFDMSMAIMPAIVLTVISLIANLSLALLGAAFGDDIMLVLQPFAQMLINTYLMIFVLGAITTVSEWNSIRACTQSKLLYMFTFPLFMLTYIPISLAALFVQVEWKPIEHRVSAAMLRAAERR